jgi:hypothetical protein
MTDENKCAHELCHCLTTDDSDYCSPFCESAATQDVAAIKCECGHSGCE